MSLDKSLRSKDVLTRHRNVLTRAERVAHLQELGKWNEDSTVTGLPKIGHRKVSVGKKDKVAKDTEADDATSTTEEAAGETKK